MLQISKHLCSLAVVQHGSRKHEAQYNYRKSICSTLLSGFLKEKKLSPLMERKLGSLVKVYASESLRSILYLNGLYFVGFLSFWCFDTEKPLKLSFPENIVFCVSSTSFQGYCHPFTKSKRERWSSKRGWFHQISRKNIS